MRVKLVTTTKKTPNYLIYYLLIYGCWDFTAAGQTKWFLLNAKPSMNVKIDAVHEVTLDCR